MYRLITLSIFAFVLGGCSSYALQQAGRHEVGPFVFDTQLDWSKFTMVKPGRNTEVWTRDGQQLNSLYFVKGLKSGQTIFNNSSAQPMPEFQPGMLPNELADFTRASLLRYLGEGSSSDGEIGMRPTNFAGDVGFLFDMNFTLENGLRYRASSVATERDGALYLVIYLGTDLHYYDAALSEFQMIIDTAQIAS